MMNGEGNSSIILEFKQKIEVKFSSNINARIVQSKSNFLGTLVEVAIPF